MGGGGARCGVLGLKDVGGVELLSWGGEGEEVRVAGVGVVPEDGREERRREGRLLIVVEAVAMKMRVDEVGVRC